MAKYQMKVGTLGFSQDQLVDEKDLVEALNIPAALSPDEVLLALSLAGIIKFTLPVEFTMIVRISPFEHLIAKYELISQEADLYRCVNPTGVFPDARSEELIALGYASKYAALTKEGVLKVKDAGHSDNRLYMEFEGGARAYAGETVYYLIGTDRSDLFFLKALKLTDHWLSTPTSDKVKFFTTPDQALEYLKEALEASIEEEQRSREDDKLFSLNNLKDFILKAETYNGSPFARRLYEGAVDNALIEMALTEEKAAA